MIFLFPKSRGYFIAGLSLCFLVAAALLHDHSPWYVILPVILAGAALSWIIASVSAFLQHRRILNVMYAELKPDEFIRIYEPLMQKARVRRNFLFSMTCYLSNACSAVGQYQKALAVLDDAPPITGMWKRQCEAILAGNRCDICCAMNAPDSAKKELKKLQMLVSEGEVSQKPILDLLQVKVHLLDGKATKEDYEVVRNLLSPSATRYYQLTVHYLLGQLNEQFGETEFARTYYSEVAKSPSEIAIASKAAARLKELPSSAETVSSENF